MLKRLTAFVLISSLLAVSFSRFVVFAGFELNKKYIISNLCENRSRPWMHCDGKCYFVKKVKQAQENEKNEERQAQKNLFQEAFVGQVLVIKFNTQLLEVVDTPCITQIAPGINRTLFQPPRQA